jgi:hypothetical protein
MSSAGYFIGSLQFKPLRQQYKERGLNLFAALSTIVQSPFYTAIYFSVNTRHPSSWNHMPGENASSSGDESKPFLIAIWSKRERHMFRKWINHKTP